MKSSGKGIFPEITQPQKGTDADSAHTAEQCPLLGVETVSEISFWPSQMNLFIADAVIGLLVNTDKISAALLDIGILVCVHGIDLDANGRKVLFGNFTGVTDIFHIRVVPGFPGEDENLSQPGFGDVAQLGVNFIIGELSAVDFIGTVKSAVSTVVDTVVGDIERSIESGSIAEVAGGFLFGAPCHLLQIGLGRRGEERRIVL